ncbi:uncharacterized protein TRIVIDRAFT_202834 [Trichoderma virens Gv29-8]|uniref:Uncharacterized protein n=1 Tax=Hypocrea virens (strain Gv29-8 / FGSC 10586) TaxID=413071 RepID=G9MYH7_HYPVG|nr:uncharacterized protein TRIVIDRAFT_202834 [Trichoderma virens Gv29-8]EHK20597.1 hypothetical protein TRIVIDRAFT_202834 [Trichoderma virens Gv29-8]
MQAVVFALLALGWRWRLLPWDASVGVLATTWYQLVGFIPVDHAMFALVQAALSAVAALRRISTIFIVHLVAASVRARRFHPFGPHCSFLCTLTPDTAVVITCLNKKEDFLLGDDVVAKLIHEYMYALYARARHEMYEATTKNGFWINVSRLSCYDSRREPVQLQSMYQVMGVVAVPWSHLQRKSSLAI